MDATAQELVARLRQNPDDAEAFAALRAHYQRIGDFASLANLLEGWAGRARDVLAGSRAMYDAGELVLGALADRERAIRMYERALQMDPRQQDSYLRLRSIFEDSGEMRRLADLLERQGTALQKVGADPRDTALLYHQLGEIWEHRFSRVDKAVHHYRKAFELDSSLVAAIYAAREIYRSAGNMKAAATLLEKEAKAELDGQRKIALWRELAHMRADKLEDQEGAAIALKRALAAAPGDLEVMADLARVYITRAERSDDARVGASDRHRAADLLYQMAQQVPTEHAMAYLEQSLDARPDHDGALSLYERFCEEIRQPQRLPSRWVAYLAHAPNRPEATYRRKSLAKAYLEAGQVDYAITTLEWLLDENDAEAAETLVELYRQVGREDDMVRALGVAASGLPPDKRVPRLRELVAALRDKGDLAAAAGFAVQILGVEPGDPEALHLLDDACRASGDYAPYRDALLGASRLSGSSAHERTMRLKQVAQLSEGKLDDKEGAVSAWRGVMALDPADSEARTSLKRLFTEVERWDDLVELLEREALSHTDPEPKAEIYRQMADVHRDRRTDLESAIVALRHLRDLLPGDLQARDDLGDALVRAGAYLEAIPLLRQRIDASSGPDRGELLRLLASILEEHVGDDEGAFEAWAQLLDENPRDLDAIAHMEAIDEASGTHERLLSTLSYKVEVIEEADRPAVFVRMAGIADGSLHDLERAAELYGRALELAPGEPAVLDKLCEIYERSDRFKDLVVLLRETANRETDAGRRAELYRRIARTLADAVGNEEGAAEAWHEVLLAGEDEEALRFLRRHATRVDDPETLQDLLDRLCQIVGDETERRDLFWERGILLSDQLDRPTDAIVALRKVVLIQPDHVAALQRLASLCEQTKDLEGLAEALWRQLDVVDDPGLRMPVAQRLADLHEKEAPQVDKAVDALYAWSEADLTDPAPLERLVPLLESASRWADLTGALDSLAGLAPDAETGSELVRRSARVAYRQLGDIDGAWARLEPRIRDHADLAAEEDLRELATGANAGERLAEMFVEMTNTTTSDDEKSRRWMDAAGVYESYLSDRERALEAVLRAFAVDLTNTGILDEADRLASEAGLWARLGQVYETLIRKADTSEIKVELLLRHAARLVETDPSASLDQTLRACSLVPLDDDVLALAEERAPLAGRTEELLHTYDKRKASAEDDAGRVEALLRSASLSETLLGDRDRCTHYLALAIALTVRSPDLASPVEAKAVELDAAAGAAGGVRRAVVEIYAVLAEDMEEDPVGGAALLVRASRILHEELSTDDDALAVLKRAALFAPSEDYVLDQLARFTRELGRLGELDVHLAKLIEEALDSKTASGLLVRRGELLEELGLHGQAAEVWSRLSTVTSGSSDARQRLRSALRKAGKLEELLGALKRDLRKMEDPEVRLGLQTEIARLWDEELRNKWEALDAWKKVLKEAPGNEEAESAITRLEQDKRRPDDSDFGVSSPAPRDPVDLPDAPESIEEPDSFEELESLEMEALPSEELMLDSGEDALEIAPEDVPEDVPEEISEEVSEDAAQFADVTDPEDDDDSLDSVTMYDSGLYRELGEALAKSVGAEPESPDSPGDPDTRDVVAPNEKVRQTRKLDAMDYPYDEPSTAQLDASVVESDTFDRQPNADPADELSMPMPTADPEDFDDDYTAVAEDVFRQIRTELKGGGEGDEEEPEELHTGEIELIDDPDSETFDADDEVIFDALAPKHDTGNRPESYNELTPLDDSIDDSFVMSLDSSVEELDAIDELADIEDLEEIEVLEEIEEIEEIEDLDGLEEIEDPDERSSVPPPIPGKR